jgi:hypothetical protein
MSHQAIPRQSLADHPDIMGRAHTTRQMKKVAGLKRGVQRIAQTITIQKDKPDRFDSVAAVEFLFTTH